MKTRKENESYGNTKEKNSYDTPAEYCNSKDLKETVSTSSSYKNLKSFKIGDF